ncbi:MAG: NAD(P)H-binding protein [Phycisphaerales bacterium]|nr:NAD(P)H-binding protein [Phycisphaerales bacterium]
MPAPLHVVTGALGYTGQALTEQLLASGARVRTLTNSPGRPNPFGNRLEVRPLAFADPGALEASLGGADVLHNTYWVRFNHRLFNFDDAVRNSAVLFEAARRAGVRRIVHVSILHAGEADDLAYYRGKRQVEDALRAGGIEHVILRPGVLFGRFDVLVNNIAWAIRRFPVFGLFGRGRYRLRPLHVDDMATLMREAAAGPAGRVIDAVGPEAYEYRALVRMIAGLIGVRRVIAPMPPWAGALVTRCAGPLVRDVIVTGEEIKGLMRGLLDSNAPATGQTRLSEWVKAEAPTLGRRYASELGRRTQRSTAYVDVR